MNRRLYVCIVLLVITVCSSGSIKNDRTDQFPSITFSEEIKNYDDVYQLLIDSIIGGRRRYRLGVYDYLSNTDDHILHFEVKEMPIELGGETRCSDLKRSPLLDTISLNSEFLKRGCKEYIIQVIAHESIHAFINWCVHSYHIHKNKVDGGFLQRAFKTDRDSIESIIKDTGHLTEVKKHSLMCRNYLDSMSRCIYQYAKNNPNFTMRIARSLAWGGLEDTPEWKKRVDTCYSRFINAAVTQFNAPDSSQAIEYPSCYTKEEIDNLKQLLIDAFQKTKSARYEGVSLY
ncbi:MAG: hypothetical protein J7621_21590 [Niastella sp.]|nr:hypothetical protein [Niastella sp.]